MQPRHLLVLPPPGAPLDQVAALALPVHPRQGFLKQVPWLDKANSILVLRLPGARGQTRRPPHTKILPETSIYDNILSQLSIFSPDLFELIQLGPELLDLGLDQRLRGQPGFLLLPLLVVDLGGEVDNNSSEGLEVLIPGTGDAPRFPDHVPHGSRGGAAVAGPLHLGGAGTNFKLARTCFLANPVLVLEAGILILVLLALPSHLPVEILLTFG